MSKKAWIENNRIRDVCPGNPAELYHPDVAVFYDTDVPDNAQNGWELVDGVWTAPVVPEPVPVDPPAPVPPKVSPVEFLLLFTAPERVAIRASMDPIVQDWLRIIDDPRLTTVDLALGSTQAGLDYLIGLGLLTAERKAEILTGVLT